MPMAWKYAHFQATIFSFQPIADGHDSRWIALQFFFISLHFLPASEILFWYIIVMLPLTIRKRAITARHLDVIQSVIDENRNKSRTQISKICAENGIGVSPMAVSKTWPVEKSSWRSIVTILSLLQKQRRSTVQYYIMCHSPRLYAIYGVRNVFSCVSARGSPEYEFFV